MPDKQTTHTDKKLIVLICGILSELFIWYSGSGIFLSILALITSCGAFFAVHFSEIEVERERRGVYQPLSRNS